MDWLTNENCFQIHPFSGRPAHPSWMTCHIWKSSVWSLCLCSKVPLSSELWIFFILSFWLLYWRRRQGISMFFVTLLTYVLCSAFCCFDKWLEVIGSACWLSMASTFCSCTATTEYQGTAREKELMVATDILFFIGAVLILMVNSCSHQSSWPKQGEIRSCLSWGWPGEGRVRSLWVIVSQKQL